MSGALCGVRPSTRIAPLVAMLAVLMNVDAAFGCSTKAAAYRTALKSDLRHLFTLQQEFRAANGRFSSDLTELQFNRSTGTIDPTFDRIGADGWVARNGHSQVEERCRIYAGARPAGVPEQVKEGEPWCDAAPFPNADAVASMFAPMTWLVLVILAITAAKFLGSTGRNWNAISLTGLVVLQSLVLPAASYCPPIAAVPSVSLLLLGVGIFAFAIRRRVGGASLA